jgi:hypothetical protein
MVNTQLQVNKIRPITLTVQPARKKEKIYPIDDTAERRLTRTDKRRRSLQEINVTAFFSDKKRFAQAFMDAVPVVGFVLTLVLVQLVMIIAGIESTEFEVFASVCFVVEVSIRIWCHTPYYFFYGYERKLSDMDRWLNCTDFLLSLSDVVGMILRYAFAGDAALTQGAKSARLLRVLKIIKCARLVRMWKVLKMFFLVFARERDKKIMERRQKVALQIRKHGKSWQIDRKAANIKGMSGGRWVQGLDLSGSNCRGKLNVEELRKKLDRTLLRKHKVVNEAGNSLCSAKPMSMLDEGGEQFREPISMFASTEELCVAFGPVVGMLFFVNQLFACAFLAMFLVSIPSMLHYTSDGYSNGTSARFEGTVLYGSAVCNNSIAVNAFINRSVYEQFMAGSDTFASFHGSNPLLLQTTVHKACYLGDAQLTTSACVVAILLLTYTTFFVMFKRFLIKVDEMQQTPSDYSIMIDDPPLDAYDPKEWIGYFGRFGEVVGVTILVNNGDLLERLAKRQYLKILVEGMDGMKFMPGISQQYRALLNSMRIGLDKIHYIEQYQRNEMAIESLMQQTYQVTSVFVTFEHEAHHRKALKTLQQGVLPAALDIAIGLPDDMLFRAGTEEAHVLALREAPEPSEILYQHAGTASSEQRSMQQLVMLLFLACFMFIEFRIVKTMAEELPALAGIVITFSNCVVPEVLHLLSHLFEVHEVVSEKVESMFNKVSLFRYFNTVIIIHMLTDWSHTLDEEHLTKVQNILIFDAIGTPFFYAFNAAHYFRRYVLANLVTDELDLHQALSGARVRISDRYSNLAKCMFVGLFYLPLLPAGALFGFVHCALANVADRVGLTHQWKPIPPSGGKTLFRILSTHVACAIITHGYMGVYFFSGWSYDETCPAEASGMDNGQYYYTCNKQQAALFNTNPPWMREEQAATVLLYQATCALALVGGSILFVVLGKDRIASLFVPTIHFGDEDQKVPWSTVDSIGLYVPSCEFAPFPAPLLACDSSQISTNRMPWKRGDTSFYCVYDGAQEVAQRLQIDITHGRVLSTVTQLKNRTWLS